MTELRIDNDTPARFVHALADPWDGYQKVMATGETRYGADLP